MLMCGILIVIYGFFRTIKLLMQLKVENKILLIQIEHETSKESELLSELSDLKNQINKSTLYDALTGLPSRQLFEDRLSQTTTQSKRYNLTFGVLFLDIDGFKVINNALGYSTGDELLKQIATRLSRSMRQVDTVCRFAGDQFVLLAPQITKAETCGYIAQRVLDAVSQPFRVNDQDLFITASVGIAVYPADGDDTSLLNNADNALNQAKSRGCNAYQFYREEMHSLSQRELILKSSLCEASIYNEFAIYYQPQVDTASKEIVSMEALLRWQHPSFGLVAAHEFLRLAENSGKIIEIGEWVLRSACEQYQKWKAADFHLKKISVNISSRQLENPHFIYKVSRILHETNIEPSSLVLEITGGIFHKVELLEKSLHMLKQLGVQVAIDDFGTGYLSLQQLKHFPIHYLKIDNILIQDVTRNTESEAIITMIIALARTLHLGVIAEGVETSDQKILLNKLGCDIMQGHLFSHPRIPEEFTASVEKTICNA
jgi:diguanylate cyclase (GGDEF)-like protein